jgi:catechol 2,3-dioxygenase-like lactoylglutathione lyase family enzyme
MPVRLHHVVIDAHDLPGLARFWTQALGWKVLSEREAEIVIGTDENALRMIEGGELKHLLAEHLNLDVRIDVGRPPANHSSTPECARNAEEYARIWRSSLG